MSSKVLKKSTMYSPTVHTGRMGVGSDHRSPLSKCGPVKSNSTHHGPHSQPRL
jgi:hypothetical protein